LAQTGHAARTAAIADSAGPADKGGDPKKVEPKKVEGEDAEIPADAYVVSLPMFEGPLDLLLSIIQKHELDILDIPVSFITEKYLEYLDVMRALPIDVASEYLVMAATLTHIKSKMLLPEPPKDQEGDGAEGEEEDPRAELVRRLLEYQKYKAAAEALGSRDTLGSAVFARGGSEPVPEGPAPFAPTGTFDLLDAFAKVLARTKVKIDHEVVFDRISISDRISELVDVLRPRRSMPFEELFPQQASRFDLVITFLAILEMARLKMMRVFQTEALSPIHVELIVVDDDVDDPLGMRPSRPPVQSSAAEEPAPEEPPAEEPAPEEPPAEEPPAEEPPTEVPPAEEPTEAPPPAEEPPGEEPPAEEPPAEEPPAEEPPAEDPNSR
jgi:segregation and condensation protein A